VKREDREHLLLLVEICVSVCLAGLIVTILISVKRVFFG
jgi:hypothetical protein